MSKAPTAAAVATSALEQAEQWIAFLSHALHAKNVANTGLRAVVAHKNEQIAQLERIAKVGAYATNTDTRRPPRPARVIPQDELDRIARMQAAKELAVRTGHADKAF